MSTDSFQGYLHSSYRLIPLKLPPEHLTVPPAESPTSPSDSQPNDATAEYPPRIRAGARAKIAPHCRSISSNPQPRREEKEGRMKKKFGNVERVRGSRKKFADLLRYSKND